VDHDADEIEISMKIEQNDLSWLPIDRSYKLEELLAKKQNKI